ncbi:hypothetical protein OS242_14575 [Tumebacillus sp. DT12]|uniref:Uncharacterized protein n=1 Tax=Tumebacillus lacus TaxID=2995335 RepID=A0ABT3X8T6_9BACL|nr:hypothetical protein [Tumebacillus lacus]MCX7571174.1 hypothetical protein [Tumebacillus lacus]
MDLYHNWVYVHVLNTPWFVWGIVLIVLTFNLLSPVILWITFSGRKIRWQSIKKQL